MLRLSDRTLRPRALQAAALLCLIWAAAACSDDKGADNDFALPTGGVDVSTAADGGGGDDASSPHVATSSDAAVPAPNTPPEFQAMQSLTLDQGASTTLDVTSLLSDAEDNKDALTLSWSAKKVALNDPGSHVLYVVAPTTWFGQEEIEITVKDTGGKTAMQVLTVTVKEVVVDKPKPPDTCGQVTFSYPAGKGDHEVLLSGSFNGWAKTADKADKLTDPGGTGTWTVDKKLDPGVHQYKFLVDGQWKADAANPNQTPDGFGGHNSVIEVAACEP